MAEISPNFVIDNCMILINIGKLNHRLKDNLLKYVCTNFSKNLMRNEKVLPILPQKLRFAAIRN